MTARNAGYDFFPIQTLLLEHNKTYGNYRYEAICQDMSSRGMSSEILWILFCIGRGWDKTKNSSRCACSSSGPRRYGADHDGRTGLWRSKVHGRHDAKGK